MAGQEHQVDQPIDMLVVSDGEHYAVGQNCTSIEATVKSGMHADIAYLRVWSMGSCVAEFCQHNVVGVYFAPPTERGN